MFRFIPFDEKKTSWFDSRKMQHLYNSSAWLNCIRDTYDFEVLLLVDEEDKYHAAFCKIDDDFGKRLISLPFSDYVPFLNTGVGYFEKLFNYCQQQYPDYQITLKTETSHELNLPQQLSRKAVYHKVKLQETESVFHKSFIRGVKKAQKSGVLIRIRNTPDALKDFYKLYHRLRINKFKSIPQPFIFFKAIYNQFIMKGDGFILEAISSDKVIASMIILEHKNTAYYKFGCSHDEFLDYKPNNLLFFELRKILFNRKFEYLDLGLSGCGDSYKGLRRWKDHVGGIMHPISYWQMGSKLPPDRVEKIAEMKIDIQKKTQQIVENRLGPWETSERSKELYKYFA
ncbi:GNAT family N-acetyltransferase [Nonlabens marinus]|uniref:BioF2-like acetyltransferase domain-containing protein n=1 Tax=Nonlabens marinus S1-08 TaxID=1454201 RepID=W8VX68_9FLAO|nr:GNAT family N-acetyltransferase [Nonlabens marinus]BAO55402.1 hypothetical protein NMS_1393 [Nonlabens marinus S1-08]